jgi:hypothetical protein
MTMSAQIISLNVYKASVAMMAAVNQCAQEAPHSTLVVPECADREKISVVGKALPLAGTTITVRLDADGFADLSHYIDDELQVDGSCYDSRRDEFESVTWAEWVTVCESISTVAYRGHARRGKSGCRTLKLPDTSLHRFLAARALAGNLVALSHDTKSGTARAKTIYDERLAAVATLDDVEGQSWAAW